MCVSSYPSSSAIVTRAAGSSFTARWAANWAATEFTAKHSERDFVDQFSRFCAAEAVDETTAAIGLGQGGE